MHILHRLHPRHPHAAHPTNRRPYYPHHPPAANKTAWWQVSTRKALTNTDSLCMVFHMKTTLNISDSVMKELKQEAARQGRTMSELVEMALRALLRNHRKAAKLPPLPELDGGGEKVDIANRDALYEVMERQ